MVVDGSCKLDRAGCDSLGVIDRKFPCGIRIDSVCVVVLALSVGTCTLGYNLTASSSSFLPHPRLESCRDLTT